MLFIDSLLVRVYALAYSPDGMTLATGGNDGCVRLWDLADGAERLCLRATRRLIVGVAWSLDGRRISATGLEAATRNCSVIDAWDAGSGEAIGTFSGGRSEGDAVLGLIGSTPPDLGKDSYHLRVEATAWRLAQARGCFEFVRKYPRAGETVFPVDETAACFPLEASTETISARAADEQSARQLEYKNEIEECRLHLPVSSHGARLGAFVPGSAGCLFYAHTLKYQRDGAAAAFSPDGQTLALTNFNWIQIWDLASRRFQVIQAWNERVLALAFAPDGRTFATAGDDQIISLWNVQRLGEPVRFDWKIGPIEAVAFSPDGSTIVGVGPSGTVVWDVGEGFDS